MSTTKELVKVMKLEDLKPLIGKEVQVRDETIALFRLSSGEVRAVGNRCPHKTAAGRRHRVGGIRVLPAA